ncbi:MAG: hypothetical protein ACP5VR_11610, partial [Acidimicrobiales bacterium]
QLRRGTDRKSAHRLVQLALAVVFLLTAKLIDWRNRWSPVSTRVRWHFLGAHREWVDNGKRRKYHLNNRLRNRLRR